MPATDPLHSPLLGDFLRSARWPPPTPAVAQRMDLALRFFDRWLHDWCQRPLQDGDRGYRLYGAHPHYKANGHATRLTGAMQAINFNCPVEVASSLRIGQPSGCVRRYGKPGEPRPAAASGLWFTRPGEPPFRLALPPEHAVAYDYQVLLDIEVLVSTAGDMVIDWGRDLPDGQPPLPGRDYAYRDGGGLQYAIPNAGRVLGPA